MSVLRLENLSHRYREQGPPTLDGIDVRVAEGEMLSIVGPSGSGKSTLLRVVAGLTPPASGQVNVAGVDVTDRPAERRGLTAMFQQPHLFDHLSVLDNVAFGPRLRGISKREARENARSYLSLVHLADLGDRRTRELSGGQQQRVALARALATEERVLLLDEPFSALDAGLRRSMHELLGEVRAALSPTILIVTHDLDEAALADRVAVLSEGRLEQVGTVPALYRRPSSVVVARLLGGFNEILGRAHEGQHLSHWGSVPLPVDCDLSGPASLLVRREQLVVEPPRRHEDGSTGLAGAGLLVRVVGVASAGARQVATIEPRGSRGGATAARLPDRIEVELPLGNLVAPGQELNLRLDKVHPVWAVPGPDTDAALVSSPLA